MKTPHTKFNQNQLSPVLKLKHMHRHTWSPLHVFTYAYSAKTVHCTQSTPMCWQNWKLPCL